MSLYIETPRLIIRELIPADDEGMLELDTDPEVHKYVGGNPIKTIGESRAVIAFVRQQYVDNGIGRWAVLHKERGDFLGWAGFKLVRDATNGHVDYYDFGYRFIRRCWGQGIATEASVGCLDYGIRELGLRDIYAMTDVHNGASRRVLEKVGFNFVEIFSFDANPGWRRDDDLTSTWYNLPHRASLL